MINIVKVISSEFDDAKRRIVKFLRIGKGDTRTAHQSSSFGVDSQPLPGMRAVFAPGEERGAPVVVGYVQTSMLAGKGETRLFSLDSEGNLKAFVWLKDDGTIQLNGEGDNLSRHSKVKESVDEIKDDINNLKDILQAWTPVANDGGGALKAALTTYFATAIQKDIDDAKIDELKIP